MGNMACTGHRKQVQ